MLQLFDVSVAPENGGVEDYLLRILARCAAWFEASGASIFLQSGESEEFRLYGQFGVDSLIPEDATIHVGVGVAGACLESRVPMLITDPTREPMLRDRIATRRQDLSSSMVVPLIDLDSKCIGVLNLSRRGNKRPFAESDLAIASSLGRHVALATANARLLAEARAARNETESILNCIGASVWVVDYNFKVIGENPAAVREFGSQLERKWEDLPSSLTKPLFVAVDRVLNRALDGRMMRASAEDDDSDKAWTVSAAPLPDGGAVVTIEDATEHRRTSREFARMKRLAEIGQMTAAIAHEIRNPLTGIRSAAQVIASDPEHAVDFAAIIEEEVLKLNDLCDDFLEFARPLSVRMDEVGLDVIATKIAQSMRGEFIAAKVTLQEEIELHMPTIRGDALRIEQVLRNLLKNALQACEPGGRVKLSVRPSEIEISDTGAGMTPDTLEKLFTPFFTTKAQGTGLGMSNVRKIIEAHSATISVDSTLGQGTRTVVRFGGAK